MLNQQRHVTWAPGMSLAMLEREVILSAYSFYRENKAATASSLGIATNTLAAKLKLYEEQDAKMKEADIARKAKDDEWLRRSRGTYHGYDTAETLQQPEGKKDAEANHRVDAQPLTAVAAEHPVSVSERAEIQDVLPAKAAAGGNGRRR